MTALIAIRTLLQFTIIYGRELVRKLTLILISFTLIFVTVAMAQEAKRVPEATEIWNAEPVKVTPGTHTSAPSDAVILDASAWVSVAGGENPWDIKDGVMTVKPGTKDIHTKKSFGDVQLHIEWRIPMLDDKYTGQDRGNSGVFLQQFYEIQVLESYEGKTYNNGQAGSLYKQHIPLVNATKPMMEWQSYDIIYTAPRFGKGDSVISPARMTVLHNGVLIQNNVALLGPTEYIGAPHYKKHGALPIILQDHDHKISYRNIWVREL